MQIQLITCGPVKLPDQGPLPLTHRGHAIYFFGGLIMVCAPAVPENISEFTAASHVRVEVPVVTSDAE
jgi:hypothetical protein